MNVFFKIINKKKDKILDANKIPLPPGRGRKKDNITDISCFATCTARKKIL